MPLSALVQYAYTPTGAQMLAAQIVGGPDWFRTDRFDIQAKAAGDAAVPAAQMKLMLQSLLEERFQLKLHRETRDMPVYNLVLLKQGPKPSQDQTPPEPRQAFISFATAGEQVSALPRGAMRIVTGPSSTTITGTALALKQIVMLLQGRSDRIVIDKTGFERLIDVHLEFSQELAQPAEAGAASAGPSAPSLFTAIEEIGLKLVSAKAPLEVLVVESARKPTEN